VTAFFILLSNLLLLILMCLHIFVLILNCIQEELLCSDSEVVKFEMDPDPPDDR
jgi:hypothetical protein